MAAGVMGALISFAWLLSWVSRSHVFKKRAGERRRYPASFCSLSSGKAALSYNFDCPPCRQLDPQLLKYKAHTGTHKSV